MAVRIILNIIGTIARRCGTVDDHDPSHAFNPLSKRDKAHLPTNASKAALALWSRKQDKKRLMMAVRARVRARVRVRLG